MKFNIPFLSIYLSFLYCASCLFTESFLLSNLEEAAPVSCFRERFSLPLRQRVAREAHRSVAFLPFLPLFTTALNTHLAAVPRPASFQELPRVQCRLLGINCYHATRVWWCGRKKRGCQKETLRVIKHTLVRVCAFAVPAE
ncbi:hypothetical protein, unlikely [Trypanosoma brucei brucei TREU927]|uniref:Uncharacterized protein n=1 Tax=Trypanosoma brucei brucei (strain 927/4 GUTat10.1) TaxID=185431 RepID=Q38DR8_TRYB2|nr:hypothetical protein, unlikely [Trypanosoma brucei brucei TREU927]EAN77052.1 hypothetical protein, unlikely [Trypanosoma brucei brucei TREU927]